MMERRVIVLAGPTGVGKSDLAVKLAQRLNGEIISCDSMQIYRGMDIGSAKIKPEDMRGFRIISWIFLTRPLPSPPLNIRHWH